MSGLRTRSDKCPGSSPVHPATSGLPRCSQRANRHSRAQFLLHQGNPCPHNKGSEDADIFQMHKFQVPSLNQGAGRAIASSIWFLACIGALTKLLRTKEQGDARHMDPRGVCSTLKKRQGGVALGAAALWRQPLSGVVTYCDGKDPGFLKTSPS